mmetsp:Transcript_19494/g.42066  ORF Transcript_19494/g.42066 Transcript_19494/m.42066 type:complete len:277 (+) Transcript_19494:570-1400(+)
MNMEGMDVVVGVDEDVLDSFAGMGPEADVVGMERSAVDKVLGEWRLVPVGAHGEDDVFCLDDIVSLDLLLFLVSGGEGHFGYGSVGKLRPDGGIDRDGGEDLIVRVAPHVKELHTLDALLADYVPTWLVELNKNFLPLSAGHNQNILSARVGVRDSIRGNDPKGDGGIVPGQVLFAFLVNYEGVLILNDTTEGAEVEDFANANVKIGGKLAIDQEGVDLRQSRLAHQEFIHLQIMSRTIVIIDHAQGGVPDNELFRQGYTKRRELVLERTLDVQQA